jgi:hypothetical protein
LHYLVRNPQVFTGALDAASRDLFDTSVPRIQSHGRSVPLSQQLQEPQGLPPIPENFDPPGINLEYNSNPMIDPNIEYDYPIVERINLPASDYTYSSAETLTRRG